MSCRTSKGNTRPSSLKLALSEYPLSTLFHKLIHQQAQIRKHEPTNIESEKLGCVANTEFQTNMRRRGVFEAGVFDLACNLICKTRLCVSEILPTICVCVGRVVMRRMEWDACGISQARPVSWIWASEGDASSDTFNAVVDCGFG